jgi:hypothetical protein
MNKPICCGKPCQPVKKEFGHYGKFFMDRNGLMWAAGSVIMYFRCRVCNHHGVPYSDSFDTSHMAAMDEVRRLGMEYDATLSP